MKVLLLAGGWSPEREVSLKGGEQIPYNFAFVVICKVTENQRLDQLFTVKLS